MRPATIQDGDAFILYDAEAAPGITAQHFEESWWQSRQSLIGSAPGRGQVRFVRADNGSTWALRHYHRGGLTGRVIADTYFWNGLERSRPWREWKLTAELHRQGLPVPQAIAARVVRTGLVYRGDLVTQRIENAEPLADLLTAAPLPSAQWIELGRLLRRFHNAGVRHDDINARNILRDAQGRFYLIDFDKAQVLRAGGWQEQNLARFKRSLEKFKMNTPGFHFETTDWTALFSAYAAVSS